MCDESKEEKKMQKGTEYELERHIEIFCAHEKTLQTKNKKN